MGQPPPHTPPPHPTTTATTPAAIHPNPAPSAFPIAPFDIKQAADKVVYDCVAVLEPPNIQAPSRESFLFPHTVVHTRTQQVGRRNTDAFTGQIGVLVSEQQGNVNSPGFTQNGTKRQNIDAK